MKRRVKRGEWAGALFLLPSLGGVLVFVLVPFVDVIRRSFANAITEEWVGLKNYGDVLANPAFRLACWNTLRFSAVCLPALLGISLVIGVILQKKTKLGDGVKTAFQIGRAHV